MFKSRRRRILAVLVLGGVAVWLGASAVVVWTSTGRPHPFRLEPAPKVDWGHVEDCSLTTADDEQIGGWFVRGDPHKPCVLLLHGNGGSRREMLPVIRWLAEAKFTALAISLRAHGDSTGEINDIGWSARHDAVAAVAFLQRECPGRPIFILGRSLGAATAIFAAGELKQSVAGYLLEQPYKSLDCAVWCRLQYHLPPGLDWLAYLGMRIWAPVFLPIDPNEISPYDHIADIPEEVPIVVISGSADRHAPIGEVREMVERVQSHAKLVVFEGARHEALDRADPQLYRATLFELLNR